MSERPRPVHSSSSSRQPFFADDTVTLWQGNALDVLPELRAGSIDCCVTSPPYLGLRDYGIEPVQWPAVTYAPMAGLPDVTVPAMSSVLGLEASSLAYIGHLVALFREVRRVLADDGTLWLNLGDSYASKARGSDAGWDKSRLSNPGHLQKAQAAALRKTGERHRGKSDGIGEKNLLGIPWRAAFALQADGWVLRNDNIWTKPNAQPESVQDRLSNRHEYVFLLAKSHRYYFDLDAIREPAVTTRSSALSWARNSKEADVPGQSMRQHRAERAAGAGKSARGRNPGDCWSISTEPFGGAHFAVMPSALADRCVRAGARRGGVVLDLFSGSGTVGMAAGKHGCRYVGIDLNPAYLAESLTSRLAQQAALTPDEQDCVPVPDVRQGDLFAEESA